MIPYKKWLFSNELLNQLGNLYENLHLYYVNTAKGVLTEIASIVK